MRELLEVTPDETLLRREALYDLQAETSQAETSQAEAAQSEAAREKEAAACS
jgi:hypothetical protein